jgi:transcriptional regulator, gntR family/aminotransferase, classes I and II
MVRGKAPILIDLPLPLELRSKKKQESIYRALREAILTGMLAKGNPLPSTRSLAQRWQVARGTVEAAFDRLRMEGYVTRKAGSGTVVSAMVPDKLIAAETPSTT